MKKKHLLFMFCAVVVAIIAGGLFNSFAAAFAGGLLATIPALGITDYDGVIKQLREQLADKQTEMRALITLSETENRDFSDDETKKYEALEKEARALEARIKRLQDAEKLNASKAGKAKSQQDKGEAEARQLELETAFRQWLRYGERGLTPAQQELLAEQRALSTGTAEKGKETVPQGFAGVLEEAIKTFGGIMEVANILYTDTGNDIDYPTVNDTNNKGAILGENTSMGESVDPVFGSVAVKAFTYSSKPVLISNQLLQDNAVNLDQVIPRMLVDRVMRAFSEHSTVGAGTSTPQGVTIGGAKGADAAVNAITYDNLVDLLHSVDEAYRKNGVFMLNDSTLKAIKKLRDDEGALIFQPSLRDGEPSTILGKRFIVNNDMPEIGASAKSIVFGDFSKYLARIVRNFSVKRLEERYADLNQTAFILFVRMDGRVIDAGTKPLKYLQHAAS